MAPSRDPELDRPLLSPPLGVSTPHSSTLEAGAYTRSLQSST